MAKFVSKNYNTISVFENSFELMDCFEVVNFSNYTNFASCVRKRILDLLYVFN